MRNFPPDLDPPVTRSLSIQFILQTLLNGFANQNIQMIDTLYFYSDILVRTSAIKESTLIFELNEIHKQLLDERAKMMVWKKWMSRYPLKEMSVPLFNPFFTALIPFLQEARSDENVLIYLIENRAHFNRYLGVGLIEAMLQSFFPAGFDQLRTLIHEGFHRRGFDTFLESVDPLIEQIRWQNV